MKTWDYTVNMSSINELGIFNAVCTKIMFIIDNFKILKKLNCFERCELFVLALKNIFHRKNRNFPEVVRTKVFDNSLPLITTQLIL